jgi:hypothetical protein
MQRWLLFFFLVAGALLLIGGIAGDALLVHHHLSGPALDEHCRSFLAVDFTNCLFALFCLYCGVCLNLPNNLKSTSCHSAIRHFCGWHSSAYLKYYGRPYSVMNPSPKWFGFFRLKGGAACQNTIPA